MTNEIEIKLPIQDVRVLRRRLKQLCARKTIPRTHELNTLYDTPGQTLRRAGKLIRIRIERVSLKKAKPSRVIITFKGPAVPVASAKERQSKYKVKEELETVVASAAPIEALLRAIGLRPAFRYEKFRTTYVLPGISGVKIEFDETPAGNFLELEGSSAAIDRAARRLGYHRDDYSTRTYADIHAETIRGRGQKMSDMLF